MKFVAISYNFQIQERIGSAETIWGNTVLNKSFIINLEEYQIDHSGTGCCYIRNIGKGFKFGNNATDTFRGKEKLGECFNAFMTLTCSVEFKYFQIERSQSWNGEYLEIGFDNQARIHCDFKEYEFSIGNPKDPSLQGISLLRG